jgi:hypothetical protein
MNTDGFISIVAFTILTLLWLGFAYGLIFNRLLLERAWRAFRGWPLVVQVIVGLLVLPVFLGLWVWQVKWALWLRLVLVIGLAWFTEYTFFPAAANAVQSAAVALFGR